MSDRHDQTLSIISYLLSDRRSDANTILNVFSINGLSYRSRCLIHNGTCIGVSRVGRVRVTLTVTVRVNSVSVTFSVRDSVK